jgi:hypothetical protein
LALNFNEPEETYAQTSSVNDSLVPTEDLPRYTPSVDAENLQAKKQE